MCELFDTRLNIDPTSQCPPQALAEALRAAEVIVQP